jgi:hypothetical protein
MSKGFVTAVNTTVTVNLDNYTGQEKPLTLSPSDTGGWVSFGPFKATRGTHIVRIEVNPDRKVIEENYADDVKVLTFSVLSEVKDHEIESEMPNPIWNYSRASEISVQIGVGTYTQANSFLVAASADGHVIAAGANDGTLLLFDERGAIMWTHDIRAETGGGVYALSVSDNGQYVAVGSWSGPNGYLSLFAANGTLLFRKVVHGLLAADVSVSNSGDLLSAGQTVTLYDKFGDVRWAASPYPEEISSLVYCYNAWYQQLKPVHFNWPVSIMEANSAVISADGSLAVIGTGGYNFDYTLGHYGVYFLDGRTGRSLWNYTDLNSGYYYFSKVFVSPDGSVVVASNEGGETYVFNRQETGDSLSWTLTLNSRDIYGYFGDVHPYWGDVLPAATRGNLIAVAVNYVWTGYMEVPGTSSVTGYEERAPYGLYLFDKGGKLTARLLGLGNGVISSVALTDSDLVVGSVGRISVYSMSEITEHAISNATATIEKAKLLGTDVQTAEQSLKKAKSMPFWFDAYLLAKQAASFALQSEKPSENQTNTISTVHPSSVTESTKLFATSSGIFSVAAALILMVAVVVAYRTIKSKRKEKRKRV